MSDGSSQTNFAQSDVSGTRYDPKYYGLQNGATWIFFFRYTCMRARFFVLLVFKALYFPFSIAFVSLC